MNSIIAIFGKSNSGKTSTIKEISKVLCKDYEITPRTVADKGKDIYHVLYINNIILGIISQGDDGEWVKEYLAELLNRKCKVIICATRTRGKTCEAVKKYENEFKIIWEKVNYSDEKNENPIKYCTVKKIVDIVKSVINDMHRTTAST